MRLDLEDGGDEGRVERADAGLGPVVVVEEEVAVELDPAGGEPLDVEVGEQDVLASEAVVGAVAGEDARVVVGRLVGQERDGGGQAEADRLGLALAVLGDSRRCRRSRCG